jgi:hypothetical protein
LYADSEGTSHFEDLEVELTLGFAAPPAEPAYAAQFLPIAQSSWLAAMPDWKGDAPHPVPRRLLFVYLEGETQITAGDGTARTFKAGDVLLAEDTQGSGHSSRVVGSSRCLGLVFALPETGD